MRVNTSLRGAEEHQMASEKSNNSDPRSSGLAPGPLPPFPESRYRRTGRTRTRDLRV